VPLGETAQQKSECCGESSERVIAESNRKRGGPMCPACVVNTAVMVAGAGSAGGILAVFIGKIRKFFRAGLFEKRKEK
jgi:hypothetical protein